MPNAKRVIVVGLDSASSRFTEKLINDGLLPNMKKVKENGVFMDAICPFPTITPSNWTTVATGTWPGTHGITDFYTHHTEDRLDRNRCGFDSRECKVEFIWELAEKEGMGTILINYPASWPGRTEKVWQVMGCGLGIENELKLNIGQLFTTKDMPLASEIELLPAKGWKGAGSNEELLEAEIRFDLRGEKKSYFLLAGEKVSVHRSRDTADILAVLKTNVWSDWIRDRIDLRKKSVNVAFRLKLMEYDRKQKQISLFLPEVFPVEDFTKPAELASELVDNVGPFLEEGAYVGLNQGLVGDDEFLELIEYQDSWYAGAAEYLMKNKDWNLLFLHAHGIDYAQHKYLRYLGQDKEKEDCLIRAYQSADKLVGALYEQADEDTLFIVVSDHGATTSGRPQEHFEAGKDDDVDMYAILKDGGYLSYEEPFPGLREIDWEKSRAIPNRSTYIYVNLKGRDPEGSVDPDEYEDVRDGVIHLLRSYRDPTTGESPFSLIMRREEARFLGLYGEEIGDIVFATHPEYSSEHGKQHPGASKNGTSLESLLIMSGPGVKKDYRSKAVVFLTDIVPTISSMMEIPVCPKCEGKILYDALEHPNFQLSQAKKLTKERNTLAKAYSEYRRLTHS